MSCTCLRRQLACDHSNSVLQCGDVGRLQMCLLLADPTQERKLSTDNIYWLMRLLTVPRGGLGFRTNDLPGHRRCGLQGLGKVSRSEVAGTWEDH